jgi:hypothetical protein
VQERQAEREKVDAQLLEALDSGTAAPLDQADWQNIRNEVHWRHAKRREETNGPKDATRR